MAEQSLTSHDPQALVQTDWLAARLNDPELRVFDCTTHRWENGPKTNLYPLKRIKKKRARGELSVVDATIQAWRSKRLAKWKRKRATGLVALPPYNKRIVS